MKGENRLKLWTMFSDSCERLQQIQKKREFKSRLTARHSRQVWSVLDGYSESAVCVRIESSKRIFSTPIILIIKISNYK